MQLSGSASTGSTKSSANMELYTHTASSSYNETMSGETLSSVSEKSCISNNVNGTHITPMSAAMAANGHVPYLVSQKNDIISSIFPCRFLPNVLYVMPACGSKCLTQRSGARVQCARFALQSCQACCALCPLILICPVCLRNRPALPCLCPSGPLLPFWLQIQVDAISEKRWFCLLWNAQKLPRKFNLMPLPMFAYFFPGSFYSV